MTMRAINATKRAVKNERQGILPRSQLGYRDNVQNVKLEPALRVGEG